MSDNLISFPGKGEPTDRECNCQGISDFEHKMKIIEKGDCQYCLYKRDTAKMLLEFMGQDVYAYSQRVPSAEFYSIDWKDILYYAIYMVRRDEKEKQEE